ncbi:MAG TPA: hypothetical protein VE988_02595 [Gemmataceae bacterium]|nr:hypothetical protein [Gemmataceae bacterium]
MNVTYKVLPNNLVKIESYLGRYSLGEFAKDGIIKIYRTNGELLAQPGVLNEQGQYVFWYPKAEDLTVRVWHNADGEVHHKQILIPAADLQNASGANEASTYGAMDWLQGHTIMALAAGLALILAGGAFYLSLRNASRLRRIEDALLVKRETASRDTTIPAAEKPLPTALPTGPVRR